MDIFAEIKVGLTDGTELTISSGDISHIMYEALNMGGVAHWADKMTVVGSKRGWNVRDQLALGGSIIIHDFRRRIDHTLTLYKLGQGIRLYFDQGSHIRIEDNHILIDDVTAEEADQMVQMALFGEVVYR